MCRLMNGIGSIQTCDQRDQRGVAHADCWNWGIWGFKVYKWKGHFLGWFVGLVVLLQKTFILPWLLWSAQYKNSFFPRRRLFQFMCPHRPATWAGSRAGPPVSECLSPRVTFLLFSSNRLSCTVYCRIEATAFFSTKSKKDARRILYRNRIIILGGLLSYTA